MFRGIFCVVMLVSSLVLPQSARGVGEVVESPSQPLRWGIGLGLNTSHSTIDGVGVSPAAFSYAVGADASFRENNPFGARLSVNYTHNDLAQSSVHELLVSAHPTYQFDADSTRFSLGLGPSYGFHLNQTNLSNGLHMGIEIRALLGQARRFFFSAKHFVPLYEGNQVRPTVFLAGLIF